MKLGKMWGKIMGQRVCVECGELFHQGPGGPAKRCPRCRADDRYGPAHRALRANLDAFYGTACTRCGRLLVLGQAIEPDHRDGGGPDEHAGFAHASCNRSAGASYGNRLRAVRRALESLEGTDRGPVRTPLVNGNGDGERHQIGDVEDLPGGRAHRWTAYGWSPMSRKW